MPALFFRTAARLLLNLAFFWFCGFPSRSTPLSRADATSSSRVHAAHILPFFFFPPPGDVHPAHILLLFSPARRQSSGRRRAIWSKGLIALARYRPALLAWRDLAFTSFDHRGPQST